MITLNYPQNNILHNCPVPAQYSAGGGLPDFHILPFSSALAGVKPREKYHIMHPNHTIRSATESRRVNSTGDGRENLSGLDRSWIAM